MDADFIEQVIKSFGGVSKMAQATGYSMNRICTWKRRGRIPSKVFGQIVLAAQTLGIDITLQQLHGLQASKMTQQVNLPSGGN